MNRKTPYKLIEKRVTVLRDSIHLALPLRLESRLNDHSSHWSETRERNNYEQLVVVADLRQALRDAGWKECNGTYTIMLTRVAPCRLDGDNLQSGWKAGRDAVARCMGIDDGSPRIDWKYDQRKPVAARTYGALIDIVKDSPPRVLKVSERYAG